MLPAERRDAFLVSSPFKSNHKVSFFFFFFLLKDLSSLPAVSEVNARAGPHQHPCSPAQGHHQVLTQVLLRQ